jgi:hypothetical protein
VCAEVKTGGAGNFPLYTSTVTAAASSRPASAASFRNSFRSNGGGAQAQVQHQRPASAQRTQQSYPSGPSYGSGLYPTQQLHYPAAAAATNGSSQRPGSARWTVDQPPPLEAFDHEEDCICTVW